MKNQQNVNAETTPLNFEKISIEIVKMNEGESFIGKFLRESERPWVEVDTKTGETQEKTIKQLHFASNISSEKEDSILFADAGMYNIFKTAGIQEKDIIKLVKLGKAEIRGGKRVNQYELYKAQ